MTEFHEQDRTGARFERVSLRGAIFTEVFLNDASMHAVDLSGELRHHVMESLTDEQLASEVTRTEPGWPRMEGCPVKECLAIVLNEEWEHRLDAERDLTALEKES